MIFIREKDEILRADGKGLREVVVITSESSQTIGEISAPVLTSEDVALAYNSMVASKVVDIETENSEILSVNEANSVDDVVTLFVYFKDSHIITYTLENDTVEISAKEIGSGSGAVESVNGQTGVVVLKAEDIENNNGDTIEEAYRTAEDQDEIDAGKENTSNKVTAFQTTPDNTHYASEKLVKDSLDAKANLSLLNKSVAEKQTGNTLSYSGDTVTINKKYINLSTGVEETATENVALATSSTAGLMSPTTVAAIQTMRSEIDALQGQTVRLLYTEKADPNAAEILAFVEDSGYTDPTKYEGIAVIVKDTNHVWKWLTDDEVFNDFGLDTVNQFTNETAGVILGSESDGQIYAEDDGTGSVNGWSTLKNRVGAVETAAADIVNKANDDEVVHLSGNETITGQKTYTAIQTYESGIETTDIKNINNQTIVEVGSVATGITVNGPVRPKTNNSKDLGTSVYCWKDLYLSGKISDGTNEITPAGLSGFITIPAPASTTLTDAEYAIFTSGKVVKVNGTFLGVTNATFYPPQVYQNVYYGMVIGKESAGSSSQIKIYYINSSKVISTSTYITYIQGNGKWNLAIDQINSKLIPTFPSNTGTFTLQQSNGTLGWLDGTPVVDTTNTTFSGDLASHKPYSFTQPLTSFSIVSLNVTTGDAVPGWTVKFKVGTNFTFSSSVTLIWRNGTPQWGEFTGGEVEILIEPSLTANTYNAWLI